MRAIGSKFLSVRPSQAGWPRISELVAPTVFPLQGKAGSSFDWDLSAIGRLGQLVEIQGKKGHHEAAKYDEQFLSTEGHDHLCKT